MWTGVPDEVSCYRLFDSLGSSCFGVWGTDTEHPGTRTSCRGDHGDAIASNADRSGYAHTHVGAEANGNQRTHADVHTRTNRNARANAHSDADAHSHANPNSHTHGCAHGNTNSHADADINPNLHCGGTGECGRKPAIGGEALVFGSIRVYRGKIQWS